MPLTYGELKVKYPNLALVLMEAAQSDGYGDCPVPEDGTVVLEQINQLQFEQMSVLEDLLLAFSNRQQETGDNALPVYEQLACGEYEVRMTILAGIMHVVGSNRVLSSVFNLLEDYIAAIHGETLPD